MTDLGRRDFFIPIPAAISEETPVSWYEGYKANVAYNNMPLFEAYEEERLFGNRERDPDLNVAANISEDLLPYYEDLVRAKDSEHLQYLEDRARIAIERRRKASEAPLTAMLAGGITDPLTLVSLIPGLQFIKVGKTFGQAVTRGAAAGLAFGVASEARRAPFAVADEPYEAASNIVATTAFSAGFGGLMRGAPYVKPFFQSSASKAGRLFRGEKFSHVWRETSTELDNFYTAASGGDFDPTVTSWMGSPSQKAMQRADLTDEIKGYFALMSYNGAVSTQGARRGRAFQSVAQDSITYQGSFYRFDEQMRNLHSQQTRGINKAARVASVYNPMSGYDDWFVETYKRYVRSQSKNPETRRIAMDGISDQQKEAIVIFKDTFKAFSDDMEFAGLTKNDAKIKNVIKVYKDELDKKTKQLMDLEDSIKRGGGATKKQSAFRDALDARQAQLRDRIDFYEGQIGKPLRQNFVAPIFYNKEMLTDTVNRRALERIFEEDFKLQRMANGEPLDGVEEDAKRTLSRIMQEDAEELMDGRISADKAGRIKHLKQRKTNIDVDKIIDYIHLDSNSIYTYMDRVGRQISFAKKFGGRNVDEVLEDLDDAMMRAGLKPKERSRLLADWYGDYERVMGTLQRNPDRWDNQAAKAAKAWTGWTFLPLAGVSAITDTGSIVMAHGMRDVMFAGFAATDTAFTGAVIREAQMAGELLDITKNVYARELLNDTARKVRPNLNERIIQRGNQVMYTLNGLAPITFAGKTLDQILVNNKFVKLSRKWADGKISLFDREYLARYGIDEDMAKFIAKAPTSKHERMDFEFANTDAWPQTTAAERDIVRKYQAAIASHANNTIVMGQTFDKPLIVDGVAYLRDNPFFQSVRKVFPSQFKIEQRLRTGNENMVRIESGMMSLPFTFMNFAFGANNKILGAIRDPNRRYRLQGIAALIGLSYMSLAIKKPDYWFEKRKTPEIMARIIDHSGVLGIYSDLAYTGLNIAGNAGMIGEDFPIPPKYVSPNREERMMDAFVEPFGAPVGLGLDYARSARDYFNGDTTDASERMRYILPFLGLPMIRNDVQALMNDYGRR
jgi:hypothetical protein